MNASEVGIGAQEEDVAELLRGGSTLKHEASWTMLNHIPGKENYGKLETVFLHSFFYIHLETFIKVLIFKPC